ncbi:hypothetical protein HAX54_048348 [Datura stramonium]|uniref:Uncharacterized protein n=1 Tax=Datura stramonium TaxID=4076 RepID=A0ABS8SU41_DATST|nr:hypothetical protein [Datura stramonium]
MRQVLRFSRETTLGDGGGQRPVRLKMDRRLWYHGFDDEDDGHQPSEGPSYVPWQLCLSIPDMMVDSTNCRGSDGSSFPPSLRASQDPFRAKD